MPEKKKWIVGWCQFFAVEAETKELAEKIIKEIKIDVHKLPWTVEPYLDNIEADLKAGR